MKVFDFDNTLYRGESAVDFALFLIRSNRKVILWLPKLFWNLLKYKLCLVRREQMEASINSFLRSCISDPEELLRLTGRFWKTRRHRLDAGIIGKIRPEDAIITASPDFLLRPIQQQLGTSHLICSEVDLVRQKVIYLNFGDRKVRRYREKYGDAEVDAFYTDSYNDRAMMEIAKKVYLVKKGTVRRIK